MLKSGFFDDMPGGTITGKNRDEGLTSALDLPRIVQEAAEGLEVQATATGEGMSEVIEQHCGFRRREIDLIYPSIFATGLSFDQPCVMQEPAVFYECVEVKALGPPFDRSGSIDIGWLLLL